MEYLRISENKFKIMLTAGDLADYHMTADRLDYGREETRRVFRRVIDAVKRRAGVPPGDERMLIRFYPLRDGGCELFATGLGTQPTREKKRTQTEEGKVRPVRRVYYRFASSETLLAAVSLLYRNKMRGEIYRDDAELYFIAAEEPCGEETASPCHILAEFGTPLPAVTEVYLSEHAHLLAGGTMSTGIFGREG